MRITNAGKIGIGTSSPVDPVSLKTATGSYGFTQTDGSITLGTYAGAGGGWFGTRSAHPLYFFTANGGSALSLLVSGNVGIGTTVPADKLTVRTGTNSYGLTQPDGSTTVGSWVGAGSSGVASGWYGTKSNAPLRLFASNGPGMVNVYPTGEVGIGSYFVYGTKLSVRSATSADAGRFENTTSGRAITATSGSGQAILGRAYSTTNGIGVYGYADVGTGVYGYAPTNTGWAGYFQGNVKVTGSYFRAQDNPLDPGNKTLSTTPVNATTVSGNVVTSAGGKAVVRLPAYFSAANTNPRYQLTVVGQFAQAIVAREIDHNTFTIRTNKPNVKVSWQVTAVRNDPWSRAHPFQAVQDKPPAQRGKYYTPGAYGKPASESIAPTPNAVASAPAKP